MKRNRVALLILVALVSLLALTACGDPTQGHLRAGDEFNKAGQYAEAVEEYEKALQLDPDNVDVMSNLGVAYYQLGQPNMAIDMYNQALANAPEDADIYSNLAAAYAQLYEPGETIEPLEMAMEHYKKAIELAPDLPAAHYGLGAVYTLLNRVDEAIASFERFQELDDGTDQQATEGARQYLDQLKGP